MPRITQKNKVIRATAILIVGSFFLFSGRSAQAFLNDYSKLWDGTLSAAEWNNLPTDFLNKTGSSTMQGPLGINIAAPAAGLQVNGPIVGTSYGGSMSAGNISAGAFGSNLGGGNYSFPGNVGIGTTSPIAALSVVGDINLTGNLLYNGSAFSSSQWLANATAIYYNAGNVGVGTSNPNSRLTVTGGDFQIDHNRSLIVNSNLNTTLLLGNYYDGQGFGYGTSTTWTASLAVEGDVKGNRFCIKEDCKAAWTDIVAAGGGGQWTVNGSDMYNANSGNVGIGLTNPSVKFEVNGLSRFGITSQNAHIGIGVGTENYSGIWQIINDNSHGDFTFGNNLYTNNDHLLYVANNHASMTGGAIVIGGNGYTNGTNSINFFANTSGAATAGATTSPSSAAMIIKGGGNVGIGLTNPTTKLDVVGSFRNTLATTHSLLGGAGNVIVMADNTGTLYSTTTSALINPIVTSASGWTASGTTVYKTDTNGNVGIGTTAPQQKLTITGTSVATSTAQTNISAYVNGGIRINGAGSYSQDAITYQASSGGGAAIAFRRGGGYDTYLDFYTNTASSIGAITQAMTINNNGNVGIGTTAPTHKLDISGGNYNNQLRIISSDPLGTGITLESTDTGGREFSIISTGTNDYPGAGTLTFWDNTNGAFAASARMVINSAGNVGIGQTNPTTKLDVSGSFRNTLATTHSLLGGAGNAVVMTDNTGTLYSTSTASFISGNSLDLWKGTKNGNIWNGDAGVGNVGIGTTAPTAQLTISSSATSTLTLNSTTAVSGAYSGLLKFQGGSTADHSWAGIAGVKESIYSDQNSLAFFTTIGGSAPAAERMRIKHNGNVGIGNTNPTDLLMVGNSASTGDVHIGVNAAAAGEAGIEFLSAGSGQSWLYRPSNSNDLRIYHISGGDAVTFKQGGNVGIETTNPGTTLDVSGTLRNTLATTHSLLGGGGNVLVMADNTGTLYSAANPTGTVLLPTGTNGQTLRNNGGTTWVADSNIYNNGTNVGIGTTNTTLGKFTVVGDAYIGSLGDGMRLSADVNYSYIDGIENPLVFRTRRTSGSDNIYFETSTTTRLFINGPSGNIGIGTTAPGALLDVKKEGTGVESRLRINAGTDGAASSANVAKLTFRIVGAGGGGIEGNISQKLVGSNFDLYVEPYTNTIFNTGNVGIGATTPGTKLDVSGTFRNTLATTHSLLGGAGNALVMTDNTGTLYSTADVSTAGLSLTSVNLVRNADLAFGENYWQAIGGYAGVVYSRVLADDVTAPVQSHKKVTVSITTLGTGDVWATGFRIINLKLNTDYNFSCYFRTTSTVDGYFHAERHYADWTGRSDVNSSGFTYANDGNWHRESYYFNTGDRPNVDMRIRGFDVLGTWDITGCQFTEGQQLNSFAVNPMDSVYVTDYKYPTAYALTPKIINNYGTMTNGYAIYVPAPEGTITNKYAFASESGAGNVGIGTTAPATALDVSGTFRNTLATTHSLLGGGGNVLVMADNTGALYTTTTSSFLSGNSGWTVSGSDVYKTITGNVGIGTTTPAARLEIASASETSAIFRTYGNDNNIHISGADYSGEVYVQTSNVTTGANAWMFGLDDDETFRIGYGAKGEITDGNTKFFLSQAGNVGIGTINPAYRLDVNGTIFGNKFVNTGVGITPTTTGLFIYDVNGQLAANDSLAVIRGYNYSNDSESNLLVVGSAGASNWERLVVKNDGWVGIGTTNPGAQLDVTGSFRNTLSTTHSLLGGGGNVLVMADNTGALYTTSTASFLSGNSGWTVNGSNVYKTVTGNVGIGTTNPDARLSIDAIDNTEAFNIYAGGTNRFSIQVNGSGTDYASFFIRGLRAMTLLEGGNVGVGTITPAYKLDISGTFRATASSSSILLDADGNISIGI